MKKVKHISTAVFLIIIGVVLGILPVVPGFIFAIIGYLVLGIHFPTLLKPLDVLASKNTRIQKVYKEAKEKVKKYI